MAAVRPGIQPIEEQTSDGDDPAVRLFSESDFGDCN
jgi:hypothetical protein